MNSCGACKSAPANLYCGTRKIFVCEGCELKKDSGCGAVWAPPNQLCQLCEERPAICFCKNDDAYLCKSCDEEIHLSNPLAKKHERISLQHPCAETSESSVTGSTDVKHEHSKCSEPTPVQPLETEKISESVQLDLAIPTKEKRDSLDLTSLDKIFDVLDFDNNFDLGFDMDATLDPFSGGAGRSPTDGVVPVFNAPAFDSPTSSSDDKSDGFNGALFNTPFTPSFFEDTFDFPKEKPLTSSMIPTGSQASVMVPQQGAISSLPVLDKEAARIPIRTHKPVWASGYEVPTETLRVGTERPMCREERVARYREKRARRTFEKTIRYESRKAYAEVRPRIKGRFATKEEVAAMKAQAALAESLGVPAPQPPSKVGSKRKQAAQGGRVAAAVVGF